MTSATKLSWRCPECRTKQPKKNNTNTSVDCRAPNITGASYESEATSVNSSEYLSLKDAYVTMRSSQRSGKELTNHSSCSPDIKTDSSGVTALDTNGISELIKREIRAAMRSELPSLISQLFQSHLDPIRDQLSELQSSVNFVSAQYDDLKNNMNVITKENKDLKTECLRLRETISNISDRLSFVEQYMRDSNLEIQGVPEHKSENIINIVKQLAQVVTLKLADNDILSCTWVAPINKKETDPEQL